MDIIRTVYTALGFDVGSLPPRKPDESLVEYWKENGDFEMRVETLKGNDATIEHSNILSKAMRSILRAHDYREASFELHPEEELIVMGDDPRIVNFTMRVAKSWHQSMHRQKKLK